MGDGTEGAISTTAFFNEMD